MKHRLLLTPVFMFAGIAVWAQPPTDKSKIVRVLSFNVYHGATMRGDFDLEVIAEVIQEANPDFVALQEVDFKTNRGKEYDLATELGHRTKLVPLFGRAMDFDSGEYGVGILSKYSFLSSRNLALPYLSGHEPRTALEILAVTASGDTLAFISTHFDHQSEQDRIAAAKSLNERIATSRYPAILAGDLNAIPGSKPIRMLEQVWGHSYHENQPEYTYPSDHPALRRGSKSPKST